MSVDSIEARRELINVLRTLGTYTDEGGWRSYSFVFRDLSPAEVRGFRAYATAHDPKSADWMGYHPICRQVWLERGLLPATDQKERS